MRLSKAQILKLLNEQVKRVYRASLISLIILVISSIASYLFLGVYKGIVMLLVTLVLVTNLLMTKKRARKRVATIYLTHRYVCNSLTFFKVVEKGKKVDCMLGGFRIDRGI